EVLHAPGTAGAPAAGRDEAEDDVVAGLEGGDAGPDLDHLARALVTTDDRQLLKAHHGGDLGIEDHVAGDEVLIGVAEARSGQLDLDLAGLGIVELDVLDAPVGSDLPEDRCTSFHGTITPWCWMTAPPYLTTR